MTVNKLKKLLEGEKVIVLEGKGIIQIDFEFNTFLSIAICKNGDEFSMNCHNTIQEALQEIEEWEL